METIMSDLFYPASHFSTPTRFLVALISMALYCPLMDKTPLTHFTPFSFHLRVLIFECSSNSAQELQERRPDPEMNLNTRTHHDLPIVAMFYNLSFAILQFNSPSIVQFTTYFAVFITIYSHHDVTLSPLSKIIFIGFLFSKLTIHESLLVHMFPPNIVKKYLLMQ